jgi:hypothetical protein
MKEGTRVTIKAVHKDDAYYEDRKDVIGLTGTLTEAVTMKPHTHWFEGAAVLLDDTCGLVSGTTLYFFQVKLEKVKE